jgi:SAM-dependent methyltransferase
VEDTRGPEYARRLVSKQGVWWKKALDVQAPYRWNVRRHQLGRTLDIGCGIGRNLATLASGSVGVDHNADSVAVARAEKLDALTVDEWMTSPHRVPESFDSLLLAHVIEHLTEEEVHDLMSSYLPYLKPDGRVFFICPQERGYASDPTHVRFTDDTSLTELSRTHRLRPLQSYSFPLPRFAGRLFTYNEFCVLARKV